MKEWWCFRAVYIAVLWAHLSIVCRIALIKSIMYPTKQLIGCFKLNHQNKSPIGKAPITTSGMNGPHQPTKHSTLYRPFYIRPTITFRTLYRGYWLDTCVRILTYQYIVFITWENTVIITNASNLIRTSHLDVQTT